MKKTLTYTCDRCEQETVIIMDEDAELACCPCCGEAADEEDAVTSEDEEETIEVHESDVEL